MNFENYFFQIYDQTQNIFQKDIFATFNDSGNISPAQLENWDTLATIYKVIQEWSKIIIMIKTKIITLPCGAREGGFVGAKVGAAVWRSVPS